MFYTTISNEIVEPSLMTLFLLVRLCFRFSYLKQDMKGRRFRVKVVINASIQSVNIFPDICF